MVRVSCFLCKEVAHAHTLLTYFYFHSIKIDTLCVLLFCLYLLSFPFVHSLFLLCLLFILLLLQWLSARKGKEWRRNFTVIFRGQVKESISIYPGHELQSGCFLSHKRGKVHPAQVVITVRLVWLQSSRKILTSSLLSIPPLLHFGFKPGFSTTLCTGVVKNIVSRYIDLAIVYCANSIPSFAFSRFLSLLSSSSS